MHQNIKPVWLIYLDTISMFKEVFAHTNVIAKSGALNTYYMMS